MLDVDRPLRDDEYDTDDDPAAGPYVETDGITRAVGAIGYVTGHIVDGCRQPLLDGSGRRLFPERFDRFYWAPQRILVDVLFDESPQTLVEAREEKHCAFKAEWCAENNMTYVVVPESLSDDVQAVRALIEQASGGPTTPAPAAVADDGEQPVEKRRPGRPRGSVTRPRAAA